MLAYHREARLVGALMQHTLCITFTPDGIVTHASQPFLEAMGYRWEELKGQHHRLFCAPEDVNTADYQAFWETLRAGHAQSDTFCRYARNGEEVWLEATYFPVTNRRGRVVEITKVANLVTGHHQRGASRKAIMQALNQSMAVIEFHPDGTIMEANDNFLRATGYRLDELEGQHHRMLCTEAFYRDEPDFWARLADGEYRSGSFERMTASGESLWLEATYNPVRDEHGRIVKVIKFATDITADVAETQAAKRAVESARASSTQTTQIAANGLAHLKNIVEGAQRTAAEVDAAQQMLTTLREQASNINNITSAIARIAAQTNLLSLNAAVEAARAGEQGKGFSVVASEVRSLANSASDSAREIERVLSANQALTADAAAKMNEVVEVSRHSETHVSDIEKIVNEILAGAREVSLSVDQLAS